jgi:hypothetical protein
MKPFNFRSTIRKQWKPFQCDKSRGRLDVEKYDEAAN